MSNEADPQGVRLLLTAAQTLLLTRSRTGAKATTPTGPTPLTATSHQPSLPYDGQTRTSQYSNNNWLNKRVPLSRTAYYVTRDRERATAPAELFGGDPAGLAVGHDSAAAAVGEEFLNSEPTFGEQILERRHVRVPVAW